MLRQIKPCSQCPEPPNYNMLGENYRLQILKVLHFLHKQFLPVVYPPALSRVLVNTSITSYFCKMRKCTQPTVHVFGG